MSEENIEIPHIGFGTFIGNEHNKLNESQRKQTTINSIIIALQTGYRIIDSSINYNNYECVGEAIRRSGIPRKEIYLICKGSGNKQEIDDSIVKIFNCRKQDIGKGYNYIDLYLIHHPVFNEEIGFENWNILKQQKDEETVLNIGLSNVYINQLNKLKELVDDKRIIMPHVLEIEIHIYCQEKETVDWCDENNVIVIAQSPLGYANIGMLLDISEVKEIAQKYQITESQLLLAYTINRDIIPIPSSRSLKHIEENFEALNIKLEEEDMIKLESLNTNLPLTETAQNAKDRDQ